MVLTRPFSNWEMELN
uniref:Uncharacterized protein n=1 Tax=Rhizophora mucronata TaxID=61149 RepID=A0A2P2NTR4_RHIMU